MSQAFNIPLDRLSWFSMRPTGGHICTELDKDDPTLTVAGNLQQLQPQSMIAHHNSAIRALKTARVRHMLTPRRNR